MTAPMDTREGLRDALEDLTGAMRFVLAFYEPGQRYLDTNAWKQAEAGARAAFKKAEQTLTAPAQGAVNPAAQFVMWCLMEGCWQGDDVDGGAAQDKAEALGLIVQTQYDPAKHGENPYCEPGDTWYVPSPELLAALGDTSTPSTQCGGGK